MLFDTLRREIRSWPLPPRFAGIVYAAVTSSIVLFAHSQWGESINQYVARKTEFSAREFLGASPTLHPRIKIFAYDDPAAAYYEATDLTLPDWAAVFATLDRSNPKRIMIDKFFDIPRSSVGLDEFAGLMTKVESPIVVASFAHSTLIPTRYQLTDIAHSPAGEATVKASLRRIDSPVDKHVGLFARKSEDSFIYGPHPKLLGGFDRIGHIVYWRDGHLHAFLATNGEEVLPHWSLWAANSFQLHSDKLVVDDHVVPLDEKQRLLINLVPVERIMTHVYSMKALIQYAKDGRKLPDRIIAPGDVVLILPAMFTGNTDWVDTPLGVMPGGFILTALVNSILSKQWLTHVPGESWYIMLAGLLGAACGIWLRGFSFWLTMPAASLLVILLGHVGFVWGNLVIPWFYPSVAVLFNAFTLFAERTRLENIKQIRLENELQTARLVQQTFIPSTPIKSRHLTIESFYQSATECSGDFWNHVPLDEDRDLIMVGDVMGHGTSAALITAMAYSASLTVTYDLADHPFPFDPSLLATRLNSVLHHSCEGEVMMTAAICLFDFATGELIFTNAGHTQAYLLPQDKQDQRAAKQDGLIRLAGRGNPTGIILESKYTSSSIKIKPGDRIILYTDGLIELENRFGKQFGRKRLLEILGSSYGKPTDLMVQTIVTKARQHQGNAPLDDDITIVVIEIDDFVASQLSRTA